MVDEAAAVAAEVAATRVAIRGRRAPRKSISTTIITIKATAQVRCDMKMKNRTSQNRLDKNPTSCSLLFFFLKLFFFFFTFCFIFFIFFFSIVDFFILF